MYQFCFVKQRDTTRLAQNTPGAGEQTDETLKSKQLKGSKEGGVHAPGHIRHFPPTLQV